ncbi:hypothetical protein [Nocardia huaxiensis]|uniref:Uncharacterized protein n=1 Tax=Nocardia huaxiensis TaxID=2755382 RepID=A0A7D6VDC7_9NOCA|nr:hypothetical protein [Nocardia huaxiensis]QLY32313.1 hypothetical protein H0264_08645 [Nocardia huaxiensis]UFS93982.1 hypothetical protein LPY97_24775 [Nocardia huaxiensis]
MNDRIMDAVSEADLVEQQIPAYPDAEAEQSSDANSEIPPVPEDDIGWTAAEGDLVEQAIPVPLDDEYDEAAGGAY